MLGARFGVNPPDDLIGDMIAEVARSHGVAISRDDPILAVVLLNQIVLRRYLEEVVAPTTDAIRGAASESIRQIEQFAEDQKTWIEQASLQDRASFLDAQKALHETWKADMETLVEGQNTALQRMVMQTVASLRAQMDGAEPRVQTTPSATRTAVPSGSPQVVTWIWIAAGMLLGIGATMTLAAVASLSLIA